MINFYAQSHLIVLGEEKQYCYHSLIFYLLCSKFSSGGAGGGEVSGLKFASSLYFVNRAGCQYSVNDTVAKQLRGFCNKVRICLILTLLQNYMAPVSGEVLVNNGSGVSNGGWYSVTPLPDNATLGNAPRITRPSVAAQDCSTTARDAVPILKKMLFHIY